MRRCGGASYSPRQLQAFVVLLGVTATLGLKQTVQLYRKNASLDSDPQRRLTNVLYYGTMQLGTPGQEITVCPDTGSAAIWTSARNTPPAVSGNSKIAPSYNGFVSNASSSFELVSYDFAEKYSSGGVIGILANDRVQLGEAVLGNASLGLVTEASVDLMGASCAGVLGLGRPGLAIRAGTSIFYRMLAQQGLLDVPSFSLWLDPTPAAEPAGSLTFGGVDSTLYTGALTNVTVISSKYWMVPLLGVHAAGVSLPVTARGAILDSSSASNLVTDRDFLVFESLPGVSYSRASGSFQVIGGCANITALPNLTVSLGSRNFTLTPQSYVVQVSGSACALGFQPGAPDNAIVLGTGFLRAYFTAYTYNATSRSSYVSFAPAAPGNTTTARRRAQELGGYPGTVTASAGSAPPPQSASAQSAAVSANALGDAADRDALVAAMLAAQAAASAPTPGPVPALSAAPASGGSAAAAALSAAAGIGAGATLIAGTPQAAPAAALAPASGPALANTAASPKAPVPASPPAEATAAAGSSAQAPLLPATAPQIASAAAPSPAPILAPATQGISNTNAELFPALVPPAPVQPPTTAIAPEAASAAALSPAPVLASATQGINSTNAELFPALVLPAPMQPPAPATAPRAASAAAPSSAPILAPATQGINNTNAELFPALVPPAPLQPPAPAPAALAAAALAPTSEPASLAAPSGPAGLPIPVYAEAALAAPAPGPVAAQPGQAPGEAPAPPPASTQAAAAAAAGPASVPSAALTAAPALQPALVAVPLVAAPAPTPAQASLGAPALAESDAVAPTSLTAPSPAPTPAMEPADISIPATPLTAAPLSAPAPAAAAAAVAGLAAPAPGPEDLAPVFSPVLAPVPAPVPSQEPADISIAVTPLSAAPASAPTPAPATAVAASPVVAMAAAAAPYPAGPVAAFSLRAPAADAAPAPAPGRAPAPAPAAEFASAAAASGAGGPQPATIDAPAMAPAPLASAAAAQAPALTPSAAPAQAPAAGTAVVATAAPAVMPPSMAPSLTPAPAPLAAAPMGARGPFGILVPEGAGNASDVQPPFQAIPGLEVLYGGLGSLWRLPLQLSSLNDTLFSSYLAAHPLTARQNRTLAKPRPPTLPGFGQPVNLVKLTDFMDTCVVGWSSVNSCRAKGLNSTACALMPFFDDVDTVPYQCPFKNETQVQVPAGSGNYMPINQQWLLVRPGTRGQQIYNVGLGKCLDICTDRAAASLCGHAGNVYLQDCDATSPTQQWLLNPTALANATVSSANRADPAVYQISNAYVPPVAMQALGAAPLNQTCMDTCKAERDAQIMPSAYGETTCNNLLPTYPSSATAFPCNAQRLPHSISQGFAIVFAPQPQSA